MNIDKCIYYLFNNTILCKIRQENYLQKKKNNFEQFHLKQKHLLININLNYFYVAFYDNVVIFKIKSSSKWKISDNHWFMNEIVRLLFQWFSWRCKAVFLALIAMLVSDTDAKPRGKRQTAGLGEWVLFWYASRLINKLITNKIKFQLLS